MALVVPPDVVKQMAKLPKADQARLWAALEAIAADLTVRQPFVTEIVGQPGVWRARKGNWRALYEIVDGDVVVDRVMHRKEVYR